MRPVITMEELLVILQGGAAPKQSATGGARYITEDCVVHRGYPKASESGAFTGRAGSITRSRKGATRRQPNGNRQYIGPDGAPSVIAYVPKRVV